MMVTSDWKIQTDSDENEAYRWCYNLDPKVVDDVTTYAAEQGIVNQEEVYKIAAKIIRTANYILQCAYNSVSRGEKSGTNNGTGADLEPKYNKLLEKIVLSTWGFKLTPHMEKINSIGGRYTIFRIEWPNANEVTCAKPKFEPFLPSNKSDFSACQSFREQEYLTDIILCCEDGMYPAHRLLLASRSDFFKAAFKIGMKESTHPTFNIDAKGLGTDKQHLEEFLDFLYTDKLELKGRSIADIAKLLTLGKAYFVDGLVKACVYEIAQQFNAKNVDEIEAIGKKHDIQELIDLCEWYKNSPVKHLTPFPDTAIRYQYGELLPPQKWV